MPVSAAPEAPGTKPDRILGCRTGPRPGPTLVVVGGLHGNEPAGLEAAQRVFTRLEATDFPRRGRVIAVRGNLTALVSCDTASRGNPRYVDADLNRLFLHNGERVPTDRPGVEHAERLELEAILAHEAANARGGTFVIDLHTVSSDSPPFVAVEDSLAGRRFASAFGLPLILGVEEELRGLLMDYATNRLGCVSAVIEAGRHDDPRAIDTHEAAIWVALAETGLVPIDAIDHRRPPRAFLTQAARGRARHVYEIAFVHEIRDRNFRMTPGLDAFAAVRAKRTRIATERDEPLVTPISGLLFMPNRQADPRPGDDGYFIVRRVRRPWLALSAWLRGRDWLHWLLPRLLPGVRRRPGHEHDLLVGPDIAVVFRTQIFHLLGYRVVRRGPLCFDSPPRRAFGAAKAAVHAAGVLLAGVVRGGEPAALPGERPEDWVVRRRTLDLADR